MPLYPMPNYEGRQQRAHFAVKPSFFKIPAMYIAGAKPGQLVSLYRSTQYTRALQTYTTVEPGLGRLRAEGAALGLCSARAEEPLQYDETVGRRARRAGRRPGAAGRAVLLLPHPERHHAALRAGGVPLLLPPRVPLAERRVRGERRAAGGVLRRRAAPAHHGAVLRA